MDTTLQAAIIGGAIGFISGGVSQIIASSLSNRSKERECKLSLAKEVFMEAASALEKVTDVLAGLANLDTKRGQIFGAAAPTGWVSRLALVAENESTVRAVSKALAFSTKASVTLILLRLRVELIDSQLAITKHALEYWQVRYNSAAQGPGHVGLQESASETEKLLAQEQHLLRAREHEQLNLNLEVLRELGAYRELFAVAIAEMRKERKFSANAPWLPQVVQEVQAEQQADLIRFVEGIKALQVKTE